MELPDFRLEVEIDDNGVKLARVVGRFDVEEWLRQERSVRTRIGEALATPGRPHVVDLRHCIPPKRDWPATFKRVATALDEWRDAPSRRALIIDSGYAVEIGIKFYLEFERLFRRTAVETRTFRDFDAAYAWATEQWLANGG